MTDGKLYAKMAQVMGLVSRIPKSGYNDHFKYAYATSEDVADTVRDALAEVGLAFFVNITNVVQENKKTIVSMEFTFADGETGETHISAWQGEALDSQDKGISKAITAATKYFLLKTFLISTGDEVDPDANGKVDPEPVKAKKAAKVEEPKQETGRPYPPDKVKAGILSRAAKGEAFQPTQPQLNLLRHGLELCFPGDEAMEDKRHTLMNYISGNPSTVITDGPLFKAIVDDWLKIKQPSDGGGAYAVDPMAITEAQSIVTEALKLEGQQELI